MRPPSLAMMLFGLLVGAQIGRDCECLESLNRACISLGNLCNLVIYCSDRHNARKGCRAVCNAVFEPTLDTLISLDNVVL
jgi:hypothetical protein